MKQRVKSTQGLKNSRKYFWIIRVQDNRHTHTKNIYFFSLFCSDIFIQFTKKESLQALISFVASHTVTIYDYPAASTGFRTLYRLTNPRVKSRPELVQTLSLHPIRQTTYYMPTSQTAGHKLRGKTSLILQNSIITLRKQFASLFPPVKELH